MAKPTPMQLRNIVIAVLAAGFAIFNAVRGGQVWLTAVFGIGCVLAIGSAFLNRGPQNR